MNRFPSSNYAIDALVLVLVKYMKHLDIELPQATSEQGF